MNTPSPFANHAAHWLWQTSWQAAALAVVILAAQLVFRNRLAPRWRYGLWLLLIVRLLMPAPPPSAISIFNLAKFTPQTASLVAAPATPTPVAFPISPAGAPAEFSPSDHPAPVANIANPQTSARTKRPVNWFNLACAIWIVVAALLTLRLIWSNARFNLRLARHVPVADPAILQLAAECAAALGVEPVAIFETQEVDSPAVCGFWKKRLLLPDGVFERFSPAELRHIFMHEFAHLKRRDLEINWIATVLQILHWFNPVLWFAFARMRADRELATDALALEHAGATESVRYGETLLKALEHLSRAARQPGLVGIAESKSLLRERLRAIRRCGAARPWRWAAIGITAIIAGVGLTNARQTEAPVAQHDNRKLEKKDIRTVEITPQGLYLYERKPMNGFYSYRHNTMTLDEVTAALTQDFHDDPNLLVFLRAPDDDPKNLAINFLDRCRKLGLTNITVRSDLRVRPATTTYVPSSNTTYTVTANGSAPLSYQWLFNGSNIPPATNGAVEDAMGHEDGKVEKKDIRTVEITPQGSYLYEQKPMTLDQISASLARDFHGNSNLLVCIRADKNAEYKLVANILDRCQKGGIVKITLRADPRVLPATSTNAPSSNATFTTTATGTAPFTYQWQFNGSNIPPPVTRDQLLHPGITPTNPVTNLQIVAPPLSYNSPATNAWTAGFKVDLKDTLLVGRATLPPGKSAPITVLIYRATLKPDLAKRGKTDWRRPELTYPSSVPYPHLPIRADADGEGRFKIGPLDPRWLYYVVVIVPGCHQENFTNVDVGAGPLNASLKEINPAEVPGNSSIHGRVLNPENKPVAGALVTISGITRSNTMLFGPVAIEKYTITDADGKFTVYAPTPFTMCEGNVQADGFATALFENWTPDDSNKRRNRTEPSHDVHLVEGATVRGRLVHAGVPVANAKIHLNRFGRESGSMAWDRTTLTDGEGRFSFAHLPPDRGCLLRGDMGALGDQGVIPMLQVNIPDSGATNDIGEVKLNPAFSVTGRIHLDDGKPIPANSFLYFGSYGGGGTEWWGQSSSVNLADDGSFRLAGVPAGKTTIYLRVDDYELTPTDYQMIAGPSTNITVTANISDLLIEMHPHVGK